MFIIRWGSQRVRRRVASANTCHCPDCAGEQPALLEVNYTLRHISYIVRWVTDRNYFAVCGRCGAVADRLNVKTAEKTFKKHPIPWYDRLGWFVFPAGFLAVVVPLGVIGDTVTKNHDLALLATPQVGDLYEVDFGSSGDIKCPECRYGSALVTAVDDKMVYVHPGKRVYNQIFDLKDIAGEKNTDGFDQDVYAIPKQKLAEMRQNRKLLEVLR